MLAQWIALALAGHAVAPAGSKATSFAEHASHRTSEANVQDLAGQWLDLGSARGLRSIHLDFIRADVVVQSSTSARLRLRIDVPDGARDLDGVSIRMEHGGAMIGLTDVYPAQTAYARMIECLPEIDGRGDFWIASSHLRVTVSAPVSLIVDGLVRDGTLRDERKSLSAFSPR